MGKYKMIACDLDGTLLGSDLHVSDENKNAIKELNKKGVFFVPCSGRSLAEMQELVDNPDIRYIIYSTGTGVWDKQMGEIIDFSMNKELRQKAFDIVFKYDAFHFLHADGKCYNDADMLGREEEFWFNEALHDIVDNMAIHINDFKKNVFNMKIECISIMFKNSEDSQKCREELNSTGYFNIAAPWENNLEIVSLKAGKANAIKALAEKLKIDIEDVIAIGDSDNDLEALKEAGLGIATSNGSKEIKKIADDIGCSNDEHIVKYVLDKFF